MKTFVVVVGFGKQNPLVGFDKQIGVAGDKQIVGHLGFETKRFVGHFQLETRLVAFA